MLHGRRVEMPCLDREEGETMTLPASVREQAKWTDDVLTAIGEGWRADGVMLSRGDECIWIRGQEAVGWYGVLWSIGRG